MVPPQALAKLPGSAELQSLKHAARTAYGVPAGAGIVCAPGTSALIQVLPRIYEPAEVVVLGPTYAEHAPAWAREGHGVEEMRSICSLAASPCNIGVVVHPNNPTGLTQEVDGLLGLAEEMAERGGVLVVDEAFADVAPELSVAPYAGTPGLVVLRSFGKFYGLAGVRLGFALSDVETAAKLEDLLGPWAVPGPAIWAGTQALNDQDWQDATRERLAKDRERLDGILKRAGIRVVGGTDLFRLSTCNSSDTLFERLARAGILVRVFPDHPTWLRFGLPGAEADWDRLETVLRD